MARGTAASAAGAAQDAGATVTRSAPFEWLARAGFVARGLIYVIIGVLALKLAAGLGGKTTNQQGALRTIAHQPFGRILLLAVAIGLGGYALWRIVRAAVGQHGDSALDRISGLASGLVYAGMCLIAVKLLVGAKPSTTANPHKATAGVFGWPAGTWIVGLVGAVLIGVGLYQGYRGLSKDFLDDSKTEQMSPSGRRWFERIGILGYLARMVVFGLIGVFLIKAAVDFRAKTAIGLDGALAKLAHQPYGHLLLGVVAAGLIAFGVYSLADARYRKI
ncbi:MAG: DUF1206 domain-containing protein [Gaiellaceae bacterium]